MSMRFFVAPLGKFWVALLATWAAGSSFAACSRVLQVPISPAGISVTIQGTAVSGIYPDMLRQVGAKIGCQFSFSAVPRARQELLFDVGESDILMPAVHSIERDKVGHFVALVQTRAMLISLDTKHTPIANFTQLLENTGLRVAVVRGFDYGPAYLAAKDSLEKQGRLLQETTPANVARLLHEGLADVAIMAPSTMAATLLGHERFESMMNKLRIEALEELTWNDAGLYISRRSVTDADRAALEAGLKSVEKSGAVYEQFRLKLPARLIQASMRPK